jgi:hypothetical protein
VNIWALAKIGERDAILVRDDRSDIGVKQRTIFRNEMFMQIDCGVVAPIR